MTNFGAGAFCWRSFARKYAKFYLLFSTKRWHHHHYKPSSLRLKVVVILRVVPLKGIDYYNSIVYDDFIHFNLNFRLTCDVGWSGVGCPERIPRINLLLNF